MTVLTRSGSMLSRHDVNNALAAFAVRAGLEELALGPDNVTSAEFGDEGIVAICYDEAAGSLRLLSPVGQLDAFAPLSGQAAMLRAALGFNIENMCSLGLETDAGVFLLSLRIYTLDRFGDEIIDFARQSVGVANWLEEFDVEASSHAVVDPSAMQNDPATVVLKP
ncbi:hypothetical protein SIAM614_01099 [Stappia aggregata IAM 12614]|uniref:Tir chaperone family protein CesT n=1 Tax=Roseibium aggregatum (strain ATCC 25650 / DSM 13394 / JCM 20685 / NBRC 16684 / NCIMB 2208 / IAM 12614 / B1) TaxID=384765 RepID=A0P0N0_ROSAI|nr:type III secretion system chaperone [Roseibium aggregatum]EAV41344.1 hypothetical protein SIAM614_01099 [Stappia aggregata IAM 12614] [Roseibium aggregatum IAM 12614]